MQISTQNNYSSIPMTDISKNIPAVPTDIVKQEKGFIDSLNQNAYNNFDFGEDISQYTEVDLVQDKTNKEVVDFLTSFINEDTPEGKKNLEAFDIQKHDIDFIVIRAIEHFSASLLREQNNNTDNHKQKEPEFDMSRGFSVVGTNGESIKGMSMEDMKDFLGEDYAKNSVYTLEELIKETGVFIVDFDERQKKFTYETRKVELMTLVSMEDGFNTYTVEEIDSLYLERFKNRYSFTDEFSKTEKFQDFYNMHRTKKTEERENLNQSLQSSSAEYIISKVLGNDLSKSEVIEHYSSIATEFKDLLSRVNKFVNSDSSIKKELQDTIDIYDKITDGLKDMWRFGDLDVRG